jgi:hypothetical protein
MAGVHLLVRQGTKLGITNIDSDKKENRTYDDNFYRRGRIAAALSNGARLPITDILYRLRSGSGWRPRPDVLDACSGQGTGPVVCANYQPLPDRT